MKAGENSERRVVPEYNSFGITEAEYEDFWLWARAWSDRWRSFLNDEVFGYGVPLPYQKLSLITHLTFHDRAMLAVVGLFYSTIHEQTSK